MRFAGHSSYLSYQQLMLTNAPKILSEHRQAAKICSQVRLQFGLAAMTGKQRFVGRAPGRLDLMGGNGHYTGGLAFEATIAAGAWATVELREDRQLRFFNP